MAGEKQSHGPAFGGAGTRKQGRPYLISQTAQETAGRQSVQCAVRTAARRRVYREHETCPEVGVFLELYQGLNQNKDALTQFNFT